MQIGVRDVGCDANRIAVTVSGGSVGRHQTGIQAWQRRAWPSIGVRVEQPVEQAVTIFVEVVQRILFVTHLPAYRPGIVLVPRR